MYLFCITYRLKYTSQSKVNKLVVFASTNDSVQFHENILSTFLNRKFNMYLEDEFDSDYNDDSDDDVERKKRNSKNKALKESSSLNKVCDLFSLYGNMDQHKRAEILSKFCKASSGVLVCTVCYNYYN